MPTLGAARAGAGDRRARRLAADPVNSESPAGDGGVAFSVRFDANDLKFAQRTPGHERECKQCSDRKPIHCRLRWASEQNFKSPEAGSDPLCWGARRRNRRWVDPASRTGSMPRLRAFPGTSSFGSGMDFPSKSVRERAAHYEQDAEKFRRMAAAEPVEHIRQELLGVAEQYQGLVDTLKNRARLITS